VTEPASSDSGTPAVPPAPEVARSVFGPALADAERYVARLATDGVTRGLIGPREVPRL
jgi:16S rRNA (guanine527-N7)-methyltransferase